MKKTGLIATVLIALTLVVTPIYQNSFSIGQTAQLLPASYFSGASSLQENFTIVVLPDTQGYSQNYPWIFDNQTQWIADNLEAQNIIFVTQIGDLVNNPFDLTQWKNANQSMSKLDGKVPWAVLPGNHDMKERNVTNFNTYFGPGRFSGEAWYGGTFRADDNSNSYQLFSAGGKDYLILQLQYDANDDVLYWASNVIEKYPERKVIIATHDYLDFVNPNQRSDIGEHIWHSLVKSHADQVFLVLCGHAGAERFITDEVNGHVVYQILADFQNENDVESGWLRILQFSPSQNKIFIKTYSPLLNQYKDHVDSQFVIDYKTVKVLPERIGGTTNENNTIYIRPNGVVEPLTAPIQRNGDTYTFRDNIFGSIIIERDNAVIDGAGFTLQGTGEDDHRPSSNFVLNPGIFDGWRPSESYITPDSNNTGIYSYAQGLTVKNLKITQCWCAIELEYSADHTIVQNQIIDNTMGIRIGYSSNNLIADNTIANSEQAITSMSSHDTIQSNTITNNTEYGIKLSWAFNTVSKNTLANNRQGVLVLSSYNSFNNNVFLYNSEQVHLSLKPILNSWDNGEIGNYWSDYNGQGYYFIDENNVDHYPLTQTPNKLSVGFMLPAAVIVLAVSIVISLLLYRRPKKPSTEKTP